LLAFDSLPFSLDSTTMCGGAADGGEALGVHWRSSHVIAQLD